MEYEADSKQLVTKAKDSSATTLTTLDQDQQDIGEPHWHRIRSSWTQNHTPYSPKFIAEISYRKHAALRDVQPGHFDTIYSSLVAGRKFQKGMPLSFVMLVIVHGWRREGLVPLDWPNVNAS